MKKISFDLDWLFWQDGQETQKTAISLPHDAMLHRDRIPKLKNGSYTGYFPSGDYWYEKQFVADKSWKDRSVILEFEGVYMDSTVYLNGEKLGGRYYGYSNFFVDLTGHLKLGEENELRVFAHCSQVPNARWYPGNGIYRPVNLYIGDATHILPEGVVIDTLSTDPPKVRIRTETSGEAEVSISIFDGERQIAETTGADTEVVLHGAELWSGEHPKLYRAEIRLTKNGKEVDRTEERFGIRMLKWDSENGFQVNGKTVKMRGGCVHHDNGILGACEYEKAAFRRVRIMKEAGFNALRSSHYPLSKAMLRACDELGMYVMDESFDNWRESGGLYCYALYFDDEWRKDLESMIRKDRNHPCVILYSIGNEISDTATPDGIALTKEMTDYCHSLDETRPVTVCPNVMMNMLGGMGISLGISDTEPKRDDVTDPLLEDKDSKLGGSAMINIIVAAAPALMKVLMTPKRTEKGVGGCYGNVDIAGYNYGHKVYEGHHEMCPDRVIVGSETMPPQIVQNWALVEKCPYVIGDFMWTAWDYLGEAGAGLIEYGKKSGFTKPYPAVTGATGAIDLLGKRDTISYLAGAAWKTDNRPYIAVRPVDKYQEKVHYSGYRHTDAVGSWTWPGCDGKKTEVQVIGNGHKAELKINGRSCGKKKLKDCVAKFAVTYEPGTIEAILYDAKGRRLSENRWNTAGADTVLTVSCADEVLKANGEDIAFLDVSITDEDGITKMLSDRKVTVTVEGPAELIAAGSANPTATESYTGNSFTTYRGCMQAIVRSTTEPGEVLVRFAADGLEEKTVSLKVTR